MTLDCRTVALTPRLPPEKAKSTRPYSARMSRSLSRTLRMGPRVGAARLEKIAIIRV
jgi:hypothetical protein